MTTRQTVSRGPAVGHHNTAAVDVAAGSTGSALLLQMLLLMLMLM
jgi:hypothetical protein